MKHFVRAPDVQILLEAGHPNFWRNRYWVPSIAGVETKPLACSQKPTVEEDDHPLISEHEYFKSQIRIPAKKVEVTTRTVAYEKYQFSTPIASRPCIECDCNVLEDGAVSRQVCVDGKINLARGVSGDSSFFILAPISPETFKVVAHIYFG